MTDFFQYLVGHVHCPKSVDDRNSCIGIINVGIEVLPTKKMQSQMSSGVAYYEGEVYNVLRRRRGNPPVPLLILGIEP